MDEMIFRRCRPPWVTEGYEHAHKDLLGNYIHFIGKNIDIEEPRRILILGPFSPGSNQRVLFYLTR